MPRVTVPLSQSKLMKVDAATGRLRSREYRLTIVSGPGTGGSTLLDQPLVVGSSESAGFKLEDETVSGNHVELTPRADGVRVKDLGSTNGTQVAGARITEALVESEATLTVGKTLLRISVFEADLGAPLGPSELGGVVAESRAMRKVLGLIQKLARSDVPVVLLGETGTGKDVLAQALHQVSDRAEAPFVVFDCSAVAPNLIESELFGHTKGAFTGATGDRKGAFMQAHGGTLLLDELGELPLELQTRLLRALEAGVVKRVGEDSWRPVDVRIVAATHRDLEAAVRAGTFRQDLYYRLAVAMVRVPPLRERIEDLDVLVRRFVRELNREDFELPQELRARMAAYAWPGNVRELRNVVARALLGDENALDAAGTSTSSSSLPAASARAELALEMPFKEAKERLVDSFTKDYFEALLKKHGGNISRAAKAAGIARPYFHKLVVKYGLKADDA
ncbi:MAG: sigma 54-interacting transcriptional regulator [Myxococcaceae bacterium]